MGALHDSLKEVQETREGKYSIALKKYSAEKAAIQQPAVPARPRGALSPSPEDQPKIRTPAGWMLKVILSSAVLLILAVNIAVFLTLKNYLSEEKRKKAAGKTVPAKQSETRIKTVSSSKTPSRPAHRAKRR